MKPRITVFTPTYNRAHLLHNIYESLLRQDSDAFIWLVIDDGSEDNTKEIVTTWMAEEHIKIQYVFKENGGLHTGYNKAIELMDTELSICIDSDDYLPDNCIGRILKYWDENKRSNIAGIIGLDIDREGEVIGNSLPNVKTINPSVLLADRRTGDKKYVVRTDCYREVFPMPVYEDEKNFNPHYMIIKMCRRYRFLVFNEPLCIVNYQVDGMSANIFRQYVDSPRSFAELRRAIMELPSIPLNYLETTVIHYVSSSLLAKNRKFIKESPRKVLTVVNIPFGVLLTLYIKYKCSVLAKKKE